MATDVHVEAKIVVGFCEKGKIGFLRKPNTQF